MFIFTIIIILLVFKVCVKPGYNQTRLKDLGYGNIFDYLKGISPKDHDVFVAWPGEDSEQNATGKKCWFY